MHEAEPENERECLEGDQSPFSQRIASSFSLGNNETIDCVRG